MKTILYATDGSLAAQKALGYAVDMVRPGAARLLILHVQRRHGIHEVPAGMEDYEKLEHVRVTEADILRRASETLVNNAANDAGKLGAGDVTTLVREGDPAQVILTVAVEEGADTIVLGNRGHGDIASLLLGSVSHKVAHLAPCTCVIVR